MQQITIFVGDTGCGKSSTINALLSRFGDASQTGRAEVGDTAESCTKSAGHYPCGGTFGTLIDTMGLKDSDVKMSDEEILRQPMREIEQFATGRGKGRGVNARIVWFCRPNSRADGSLVQQADFIEGVLGQRNTAGWESVMIVVKKGIDGDAMQGAVSCAPRGVRDALRRRVVMADVMDWGLRNDEKRARRMRRRRRDSVTVRHEDGLFTEDEFVWAIHGVIESMPSTPLTFNHEKCTKCGQRGDSRYFEPFCHWEMQGYHPYEERYHSGSRDTEYETTHSSRRYHSGYWDETERVGRTIATHFLTFGIGTIINAATDGGINGAWSCCSNGKRSAPGCCVERVSKEVESGSYTCSSCNNNWNSVGCAQRCGSCGSYDSTSYCRFKCPRCNKSPGKSPGCSPILDLYSSPQHSVIALS